MIVLKPRPYDMRGNFVTSLTEIKLWDVVLDDDGTTAVPDLRSSATITKVSATETETNVWSMTLSDDLSTVVTGLAKTSEPDVTSSTEDTVNGPYSWLCTLTDDQIETVLAANGTPIVGSFVYFLVHAITAGYHVEPTWLSLTAAEVAKWC